MRILLADAGFGDVEIMAEAKMADFDSPEDFIRYQMDNPLARQWKLTDEKRTALLADIRTQLQPMVADGRLRFPRGANIALARRG